MLRLLLLFAIFLLSCSQKEKITILSAAGLKEPITEMVEKFERKNPNIAVDVVFAGSGNLLVKLENRLGDIYIPAAEEYIKKAVKEGLIKPSSVRVLAYHEPVLVVRKSINVKGLKDLLTKPVEIGIADPKEAAIGRITYEIFKKAGLWEELEKRVKVKVATVNQLVLYFNTGQIDAAVIWKELAPKVKDAKVVEFPEGLRILEKIPIGIATFTKNEKPAEKFLNFAVKERGIFEKYGFITK